MEEALRESAAGATVDGAATDQADNIPHVRSAAASLSLLYVLLCTACTELVCVCSFLSCVQSAYTLVVKVHVPCLVISVVVDSFCWP